MTEISLLIMSKVRINMESQFLSCCTCTDGCRDRCPCKIQTVEGARRLNALYQSYQFGRLVDIIATGIYECGNGCLCRKNTEKPCQNSIVQRGIRQELQLFKTFKKVQKHFELKLLSLFSRDGEFEPCAIYHLAPSFVYTRE